MATKAFANWIFAATLAAMVAGIFVPQHTAESQTVSDTAKPTPAPAAAPTPPPANLPEVQDLKESVSGQEQKTEVLEQQTKRNATKAVKVERKLERALKVQESNGAKDGNEPSAADTVFRVVPVDVYVPVPVSEPNERRSIFARIRAIFSKK